MKNLFLKIIIPFFCIIILVGMFFKFNFFQEEQFSIDIKNLKLNNTENNQIHVIQLLSISPITFTIANDQTFWIAGRNKLVNISENGEFLEEIPVKNSFNAITILTDNSILAATDKQLVKIIYENGHWEEKLFANLEGEAFITSLCINENQIYIADAANKILLAYNFQGQHLWEIKGKDNFIVPSPYFCVIPDKNGGVWITNPGKFRIENYDKNGLFKSFWQPEEKSKFLGCCNPAQVAILENERFVTLEKGLIRCRIFSHSGKEERIVADKQKLFNSQYPVDEKLKGKTFPYELVVKKDESIVILDKDRKILNVFEAFKK